MAIYFNEKFKQYRKAKDLTQEQLAEIFHVSPQAISRWETGATCPDIELLPSIASYFNITVDQLLGVDKLRDEKRIDGIMKEVTEKWSSGHISETLDILKSAIGEFPHEYRLQTALALSLHQTATAESDKEIRKTTVLEAIAIYERVLENCTDDTTRTSALFSLSQCYKKIGEMEKAISTANKLATASGSRDIILEQLYKDDELHEHLSKNIANFTHMLRGAIETLANSKYESDQDEKIALIKKAISIYELIYENGDYGFGNLHLSLYYSQLAKHYYQASDFESTLTCLEKMAQCAIAFDELEDFKLHTSVAVQGLENTRKLVRHDKNRNNQCHDILHNHVPQGSFKLIKDNQRFKDVVSNLEKYAKAY